MIGINAARLGTEAALRLRRADCCTIEPGLSDDEFDRIEAEYGIQFSDDHRAFLAAGLPVSSPPQDGATWDKSFCGIVGRPGGVTTHAGRAPVTS